MTREHKLALIVGFSLILLVGVLISDHLSRARQARIVPVGPGETQVATTPPNDPLRGADGISAIQPPPSTPVTVLHDPTTTAAGTTPLPIAPDPSTTNPVLPKPTSGGGDARLAGNWPATPRSGGPDATLVREVQGMGGQITPDGVIHLPTPAARVDQTRLLGDPLPTSAVPPSTALAESVKLYTIQKGDTLLKIAQANYGAARLWHELARYNNISENGLRIGSKIKLPSREVLTGKADPRPIETAAGKPQPPLSPTTKTTPVRSSPVPAKPPEIRYATYTVKAGDTLGHISQRMLGSSRRIQDIIDLNKLDDEDTIPVGTVLKMPVKG